MAETPADALRSAIEAQKLQRRTAKDAVTRAAGAIEDDRANSAQKEGRE